MPSFPNKTSDSDALAEDICKRYEAASKDRGAWEAHWEDIAKRVWPGYTGHFVGRGQQTPGEKRTEDMVDATAALALTRFAPAMEYMLTPRNSKWHTLQASLPDLRKDREVKLWFDDLNNVLFKMRYAPKANYASQRFETYQGLGAFGTGVLYTDKLLGRGARGLRYRSIHLGEIYFLENHQGIIDTAFRCFDYSARQAMQRWGEANSDKVKEAAKQSTTAEKKFWFIHCVMPRSDYDPERRDVKGMEFGSYYVDRSEKKMIAQGGHNTFPYSISRYTQAPGEVYGRSPAMLALPSIKTLNEQKKTVLKQGHRAVDPVLLAHDDGVLDTFSLKPGAINAGGVSAEGRALVHALPVGNLALAKEMMAEERAVINDVFLVTLFQILVETPQMTATEVLERAREKGALLSPTMGRQQSEALGPQIEREIDLLQEQGLIPPMPQALLEAEGEYEIEYTSPLSRLARAEEAAGLFRTIAEVREYVAVTQDPAPLDWVDWDEAMPDLMDIQAVPPRWVRSKDAVQALREGRAQAAAEQQMIEAAPAAAGVMKATQGA